MASGMLLEFDASHHAVVNLRGLGTILESCQSHRCICCGCKSKVPLLFFQAVLAVWPIWAQISTANAAAQELYTTLGQLVTRCIRLNLS